MTSVEEHRSTASGQLSFFILTASDSRSEEDDQSGRTILELVRAAGHRVAGRCVVVDDVAEIQAALEQAWGRGADVVVLTGGTGFASRDVSVDAVTPLLDRVIEGFGELFRALSFEQVGAAAMLSRAVAGVVGRNVVYVLPGSSRAVGLAMTELILPETGHLLGQIRR